jgi:hypothetical protein
MIARSNPACRDEENGAQGMFFQQRQSIFQIRIVTVVKSYPGIPREGSALTLNFSEQL